MKIYVFLIFTILALLSFVSCNDMLDLESDGRIEMDEVFTDRYKTMGYLNSCYGYCPAPYMDRASFTDEAEDADDITSGSSYNMWYSGSVTVSNFSSYSSDGSPWEDLYEGIRKCNVFLANIWSASGYFEDEDEREGWAAQAHTLRALYYLQLIKRYGGVPIFDEPLSTDHDYSQDTRASFSEVVDFILADCDSALSAPSSENGFTWEISDNEYGIMTRAIPYAIMSEAVTYAASDLWSDGSYSWSDATEINGEALSQCLSNDYELFNHEPTNNAAQNSYALYFITSSDDQRSVDKETIYQCGSQMEVWKYAGMPSTDGQSKAGPCPTQDLVDCYETADGEPILDLSAPYSDADHLVPNYNSDADYDPANPYENRDPRFYASIYYNEAPLSLGTVEGRDDEYSLEYSGSTNGITYSYNEEDDSYTIETTTGDPYVYIAALTEDLDIVNADNPPSVTFAFEYKASAEFSPQIFLGPSIAEAYSVWPGTAAATTEYATYSGDITDMATSMGWGSIGDNIRFDLGTNSGVTIQIKNLRIEVYADAQSASTSVCESYVDGDDGISLTDRTHTSTGYYQRKFRNWQSTKNNSADGAIRLFRLAELYLNFAESAYQSNGPDVKVTIGSGMTMSACDAVNAIRERAGMPDFPSGMTTSDFEAKYRNERRVELAFEEHRYFDVRRWKILDQTDDFVTGMEISKNEDDSYTYSRFKFADRDCSSDKYLLYPIDVDEVSKMLEYTGEDWQNSGW